MKKIYKYGTGEEVPEGAIFLSTIVQEIKGNEDMHNFQSPARLVWHYFLVEVQE